MDRKRLDRRYGEFNSEHGEANKERKDLDNGGLDNKSDEDSRSWGCLNAARVANYSANKVPEELAIESRPVSGPHGINASRYGHISSILVENEVPHYSIRAVEGA